MYYLAPSGEQQDITPDSIEYDVKLEIPLPTISLALIRTLHRVLQHLPRQTDVLLRSLSIRPLGTRDTFPVRKAALNERPRFLWSVLVHPAHVLGLAPAV